MNKIARKLAWIASMCLLLLLWSMPLFATQPTQQIPPRITIETIQQLQQDGETILFVDTRSKLQWDRAEKKLPGAIRLANLRDLRKLAKAYPADTPIVTYCT